MQFKKLLYIILINHWIDNHVISNDVIIIKYLKHNGKEYGAYFVNDIVIIQNENDYKAIIHEIGKPVERCLSYVTDPMVSKIKEAVKEYNNGKNK